ncbi:sigma-70 family RNA polymerase sigma factor [Actinoplanes teichomyceticus]|uniref:RNA polymerase sigma-B factor n=1 Tax=Actinoplanes teichomyceticus TaxID=1867 RepID=A0A561WBB4_ACTTI|nr:sigma-70 family RNA polymerase sigma factor [Actinoplanes teichomyceticus]TWG21152.1 RNA polymerase sigma-B factor [Actinoplanes teichomyceticus]GIF14974.1 hypothetical protein Ate01nite_50060 [Actinoplanes teichomyceticus]
MRFEQQTATDPTGSRGTGTVREDFDEMARRYAAERSVGDSTRACRLRDEMVCAAMPLAVRLARRYRGRSEPLADLEQVARLGLVKAVDRYDPERGSFTAYAITTVLGELKRYLRDCTWGVHVPRRMQEMVLDVAQHESELTGELGRQPTTSETARRAGIDADDLDRARVSAAGYRPVSLNLPVSEDGAQLGDLFGQLDDALEGVVDRLTVADLMAALPDRERHVVVSVFYGARTQAGIAEELGISQMHVSRILSRALAWMREGLLTDRVPRWPAGADRMRTTFEIGSRLLATRDLEIRLAGEIDRDNAGDLRTALLDLIRRQPAGRRVLLRMGGVPLLDAAGLRVLLAVYEAARARGVVVVATGLTPFVRKIAVMSGLQPMLAAEDS